RFVARSAARLRQREVVGRGRLAPLGGAFGPVFHLLGFAEEVAGVDVRAADLHGPRELLRLFHLLGVHGAGVLLLRLGESTALLHVERARRDGDELLPRLVAVLVLAAVVLPQ